MKKYIIIIAGLFIFSSCEKILQKDPLDSLTPAQAFSNEQNLQLYIHSFYNDFIPSAKSIYDGDKMSDICALRDVPEYIIPGAYSAQDAGGWNWDALRNINYFLTNYNKAPISDDKKAHYAGIARFFRAWFYFEKVKQFGDVPWYNEPLTPTDDALYKAQDPRTLVMDSVLADINFACENIDDKKDNSASTITKWVALAMKSRICLFEGTFRKYQTQFGLTNTASGWLEESVDAAQKVMGSSLYDIYDTNLPKNDYRELFINEKPVDKEVLLAVIYNNSLEKWHGANWDYTSGSKGGNISLNRSFILTYLNADGTPFTTIPGYQTMEFQDEVKNRDARLFQTIRMAPYTRSDGSAAPPDFGQTYTGYQIRKFTTDDPSIDAKNGNFNSIPIFRYAEVLLNYAEAKAELGSFTAADWANTIAVLRDRAGIQNTSMPTILDTYMKENLFKDVSSPVLMEIRRERGVELAVEGFRYDDLKRWKEAELLEKDYNGIYVPAMGQMLDLNEDGDYDVSFVAKAPKPKVPGVIYYIVDNKSTKLSEGTKGTIIWRANIIKEFPEFKYLAPIPYNQLIINPNLVQNDGWDHP